MVFFFVVSIRCFFKGWCEEEEDDDNDDVVEQTEVDPAFPVVAGVVVAALWGVTTSTFLFFCGDRLSNHVLSIVFLSSSPMFLSLSLVEWIIKLTTNTSYLISYFYSYSFLKRTKVFFLVIPYKGLPYY